MALASDLHALLERAGVTGPYVLVGHSSGGAYMRVFAERYAGNCACYLFGDERGIRFDAEQRGRALGVLCHPSASPTRGRRERFGFQIHQ
jgi:pimeloyl-ACP methyl ester carboxylesterase